ncbi:MAG: hypothetical protein O2884_12310 [Chloroflexi bacterium]|nr:hypothetical protein [Chloroflexota bacterium]
MQTTSQRAIVVSIAILLAAAAAAVFAMYQPNVQAAPQAKADVQIDLMVIGQSPESVIARLGKIDPASSGFIVDSFFDITYAANIGSSGLDGVTATGFNVDSFFDISYELSVDSTGTSRFDTEMVSLSLSGPLTNPSDPTAVATALKAVGDAISPPGDPIEYMAKGTVKFFNPTK